MEGFQWNADSIQALKALHAEGRSYTEIAQALGCRSRSVVGGKIMRLRDAGEIDGPRGYACAESRPQACRDRQSPGLAHVPLIKARLGEGRNDREIADEIGIRPDEVRYVRRIKKLKGNRLYPPPKYADQLAVLVLEGHNDRHVAATLGITMEQARYERRRQNLKVPDHRREQVTNIVKGDPGSKVLAVFAEGFMGQRSRVDLAGLEPGMYHFPIDQEEGPVRFCGDDAEQGKVYCAHHAARCYTAAPPPKPLRPSHVYGARR